MADAKLIQRLRAGGIDAPETAIAEARNAGLDLAFACALLEKESGGGANVFGHDRDRNRNYIFPARDGVVPVTEELYREYKRRRKASGNTMMQGVGPTQLTWWEFQDEADREGGCWKPAVNMRVGFRRLASLMRAHGEADGARRYNGSGDAAVAYSADLRAKARAWNARLAGVPMPAPPQLLRRGDEGKRVEQVTKRLSYVRRKGSRERYLDGARKRLDAEAAAAVKSFQRDHGLDDDGVVGPRTALKLNRAVRLETARREKEKDGKDKTVPEPSKKPPKRRKARLPALVEQLRQHDAETDRAWTAITAYGQRRRQLLERLKDKQSAPPPGPAAVEGLSEMTAILLRIEAKLAQLVEAEQRELAPAPSAPAGSAVVQVTTPPPPAVESPPPPDGGAAGNGLFTPAAAPPARDLDDLTDAELLQRVERLDRALGRSRTALIRRYVAAELELARLGVKPKPGPRPAPPKKDPKAPPGRDPARAEQNVLEPGDKARRVKQSKIALARYLKRHRRGTTRGLRRKLLTEVRTPTSARVATPAWERAVREAQAIAKQPVTGRLDEALAKVLDHLWPTDAAMRRIVRATPAWRVLPGQISRNFNLSEFACNDGTRYIDGLMREQGLTKKQAKLRAKQVADRLERLRARDGNRPLRLNSVFRTKAYNARVGGVVGSAHTRGYATDVPPPAGITLEAHRAHGRAIFEGGVGIYPGQHFVHFDCDPAERGDNWVG
ncbi:MAG TPA: peptidoglycan-binding protein [Solirubrobacteraceae bacterium]|jgi:uncharacterized protein YcbK (DUF882 family)|nr:peptidoglycan-binding protein [Solirubrobacteraceae bacterium]